MPGKPIGELAREFGLAERDIVKLASNENPRGPSPAVRAAIAAATDDLSRYPDGNGFELKAALSARYRVSPEQIVLGNGSNDVLELVTQAFLRPGDAAVYSRHAFVVYPLATQARGATGIEVPARDYGHDLAGDARRDHAGDAHRVRREPQQSDRHLDSRRTSSKAFVASVPDDVLVVLDEAYNEYLAPDAARARAPRGSPRIANLVVSRTFSKAYGLAALRVGYGIMDASVADMLNRVRQPFNVNALAQAAALAALADTAYVDESRAINRAGMRQLEEGVRALGLSFVPSHANFLLIRFGDAATVYRRLLEQGVIVRPVGELRAAGVPARHDRAARGKPALPRRRRGGARRLTIARSAPAVTAGAPRVATLAVVGVGLIGGSFALALKAAGRVGTVVGIGRGRANLDAALSLGIVDRAMTLDGDWTRELAAADLVLVATPVGRISGAVRRARGPAARARDRHRRRQHQAERDRRGARAPGRCRSRASCPVIRSPAPSTPARAAAFATLFRDRNVVLTPLPETDPAATATVAGLWSACGAQVRELDPAVHDRIFAAVSHLPHVLAFALVDLLAARPDADEVFRYAASGFRDFTRIAAGSPEMWRDISLANRERARRRDRRVPCAARRDRGDGGGGGRRRARSGVRARVGGAGARGAQRSARHPRSPPMDRANARVAAPMTAPAAAPTSTSTSRR